MGNYFSVPLENLSNETKVAITIIEYDLYSALEITYPPKRIEALEKINCDKLDNSTKSKLLKSTIQDCIVDAKLKHIW